VADWLERQFDIGRKPIGVVDRSGYFTPILPEYQGAFVPYDDPEAAEAALRADELQVVLIIGNDGLSGLP
jgi:hypothetical protein